MTYQPAGKLFLSTLSLRRATVEQKPKEMDVPKISIHALLAESDRAQYNLSQIPTISIHALLAESDWTRFKRRSLKRLFLSTLSLRRATISLCVPPHSFSISIHALLAESDPKTLLIRLAVKHFYPRSPCGERQIQ